MIHSFRTLGTIECTKIGTFNHGELNKIEPKMIDISRKIEEDDSKKMIHSLRDQFICFAYLHENDVMPMLTYAFDQV